MRVFNLHKSANFGCFISINDKIINNLPPCERFQPNFRWPLAAKLLMGPKSLEVEMMARTTSIIMQNLMEIERRMSAWEDEVWFLFFFNNAVGRRPLRCVVDLLPQHIASAFVRRFRWCLHRCFVEEKHFSAYRTFFKIVARWRYDWCPNSRKKLKIWENGCKVCAHHFDHL